MANGDAMTTIASTKIDTNTAAVDFTGIPDDGGSYQHYMLFMKICATETSLHALINGTSTVSNLYQLNGQYASSNNAYTLGYNSASQSDRFQLLSPMTQNITYFLQLWMPYATSTHNMTTQGGGKDLFIRGINTSTSYSYGYWASGKCYTASAITSIRITGNSGSPIGVGSEFSLQGLPYPS